MKIAIGCDHAGYEYKEGVKAYLIRNGHKVYDFGTNSSESVDYPDFVHPTAQHVSEKKSKLGILICGSGNGVNITANKHAKIRAALCWTSELATLARQHNNANMVSIPARFVSKRMATNIVKSFIKAKFEGGRHLRRVKKISTC